MLDEMQGALSVAFGAGSGAGEHPGEGGLPGSGDGYPGCFEPVAVTGGDAGDADPASLGATWSFLNPYYQVGSRILQASPQPVTVPAYTSKCFYLEIDATWSGGASAAVKTAGSVADALALQTSADKAIIPLFLVQGAAVVCDFRKMPVAVMSETQLVEPQPQQES